MIFSPLAIIFPTIDPILVEFGPLVIRWYAVSYIAGILIGWYYLGSLCKRNPEAFSQKAYDDVIVWAIIGILLGGRIGYVLFYNSGYYFANPSEILAIWKGGMSFHGGLLGVILSMYLMCRYHKLRFLPVMDLLACVTPIGLCFGRIANFINAELYGRVTEVSWGVIFPNDPFARHPSQLYEAGLEGILLFLILLYLVFRTNALKKAGMLSGVFLIGYAISRSFVELFREPDAQIGFLFDHMTMGQLLCLPMLLLGVFLIVRAKKSHVV